MALVERLDFHNEAGDLVATLDLVAEEHGQPFVRLSPSEAAEYGEEPLQLLEGRVYQYELDRPGLALEQSSVIRSFLVGTSDRDRGTISTGLNTGLLRLYVVENGLRIGSAAVEVRSSKLTYREEYRLMLERIADAALDLMLHVPAESETRLEIDETSTVQSLQQQFFFVRGLLGGDEFDAAINQILRQPHSRLVRADEDRDLTRGVRGSAAIAQQLSGAGRRRLIPAAHPLAQRMQSQGVTSPSLPWRVTSGTYDETRDTLENRFVKFALEEFREALSQIHSRLAAAGNGAAQWAEREVVPLQNSVDNYLSHDLFEEVSPAREIPFASPVLQRKAGYREILRTWLRFNATARLVWSGGEDVFGGGKRDVATLYEYWLFFVLWDVLGNWVGENGNGILRTSLLERTAQGLGLRLKTGCYLPVEGVLIAHGGREFRLQFSYNRTFNVPQMQPLDRGLTYWGNSPNPGSWTRNMRPDFTVSIWPSMRTAEEAELDGSMIHIHFDAKYSVENVEQLFGSPEADLSIDKQLQRSGTYRRADLLKMHAYKDAIRRSQGAYILYPGAVSEAHGSTVWREYHEVVPGLGAFVIKPTNENAGKATLRTFISDILDYAGAK